MIINNVKPRPQPGIHPTTHSLTHSLTHARTHSLTHSLAYPLNCTHRQKAKGLGRMDRGNNFASASLSAGRFIHGVIKRTTNISNAPKRFLCTQSRRERIKVSKLVRLHFHPGNSCFLQPASCMHAHRPRSGWLPISRRGRCDRYFFQELIHVCGHVHASDTRTYPYLDPNRRFGREISQRRKT